MAGESLPDKAQPLLKKFTEETKKIFKERVISLYTFGSLGEHGDFSLCSDVDVVLMLDKILPSDDETVKKLWAELKATKLEYADRLSVFWSSYDDGDFSAGNGRFPPLDRLDLIRHAKLLYGEDHRKTLQEPSQKDMVLDSAQFISDFMLADGKFDQLTNNTDEILSKGARYFTKFVLFPVRLLFTLGNEKTIASNKQAVEYFTESWAKKLPKEVNELVSFAYRTRSCPADEPVSYNADTLKSALLSLYEVTIQAYAQAAKNYENTAVAEKLKQHLKDMEAATSSTHSLGLGCR